MAESSDDMEFHIKYPTSATKNSINSREKDDYVFVYDGDKLPVIVLFGWTGCKDKYLAKYSSIYEEKGCITLRCIAPVTVTFLRHDKFPRISEKLLELIHKVSLDKHPIFFHMFSNGGAFFYQHVSMQMQKKEITLRVKGAIFDSAPGERRFSSVYRAIIAILGGSAWYRVPLGLAIALFLFVVFLVMAFLKGLLELRKPQTDPLMLVDEPYTWPQLFIYSKDDKLVKYEDIEKFASKREEMGIEVKRLCFNSSPHVQHLVTHREIYINTVMTFIKDCMKSCSPQ